MSNLDEIRALTWVNLAGRADCYTPDSADSAGAAFLTSVRDALVELVEYVRADDADMDWSTLAERMDDDVHELADAAPDVYTHTLWAEFVDLGAYREDATVYGDGDASNMSKLAGVCLYIIADRLIRALLAELAEQDDDDDRVSDNPDDFDSPVQTADGRWTNRTD